MRFPRRQAGDTIVEVIIAVAVVAVVLTGAFMVTNRSTLAVRDSEEHAEALQGLQGQVELLRAAAAIPGRLSAPVLATKFCLDQTDYPHNLPYSNCAGFPTAVPYYFSISCPIPPNATCPAAIGSGVLTNFSLLVTWPSLTGTTDSVNLSYEVEVQ